MKIQSMFRHAGLLLVLSASTAFAQTSGSAVSDSISRYDNLNVQRNSATIDPQLAQKHYRRGNTYSNLDRLDEAIEEYQLSVTADPNFADSYRNLANIYYFQGKYEEAIPVLERFIQLQTERTAGLIASLNTLGELLRRSNRLEKAFEVDLKAIVNDPDNTSQVFVMGNTYYNAGDIEKAIAIYEKAITVMPNDAFIHRTLGRMYEESGRLEDALVEYRAAAELDSGSQFYKELVKTTESRLGL
ncbi:MAG: tetratricopeptide repeat protein [Pseudohongiellaceae bacterium]|nr:tetratricopeptide repeat protein [Pseudohongiellaceae bacterium]